MGVSWGDQEATAGPCDMATSTSGVSRRSRLLARLGLVRRPVDLPALPTEDEITEQLRDAFQGERVRDTGIRAFASISRSPRAIVSEQDGDRATHMQSPVPSPSAQAAMEPLRQ